MNDLQGYYRELTAKLKALADSTPVRKVEEARQRALNELLEKIQGSDIRERVEETFQQQQRSFVDFARAVQGVLSAQQQAVAELISQWERGISERLPGIDRRDEDEDELAPFPPPPAAVSAPVSAPLSVTGAEPAAKTAAKKSAAKKTAKKAPAKKAAAKKAPAEGAQTAKTAAKKTATKKATTKKATAKKATAKKAPPAQS